MNGTPEVLIDPNTWSEDGTVPVDGFAPSKDGKLLAYGVSRSGSDWQEYRVLDLATRKLLADKIEWVKVSGVAWRGNGFYYSRYPAPAKGKELSSINENHLVYYHRIGTPQSQDELVFRDQKNPQRFHTLTTTEDERFAVLDISDRGTGKQGNAVFVLDLSKPGAKFTPLIPDIGDDTYNVLENVRGELLVFTDNNAPNGRVVRIDPANPAPANWKVILRGEARHDRQRRGGRRQGHRHLHEGRGVEGLRPQPRRRARERNRAAGPRQRQRLRRQHGRQVALLHLHVVHLSDVDLPLRHRGAKELAVPRAEIPGLDTNQYETKQVFVTSKDGAKVPMFLVHKKGLVLDGNNPTLMYGYGGFNIATTPGFNSLRIALLEQGFVYASVNMRGGSEYGEAWHDAGTKLKKQNVFDDFIAAAEWLIANKYTIPAKLAAQGGSNGGLLVGAVINQRPESLPRRDSAGRRHGHAALPQVHDRLELDRRLRLERQRRGVQGAPRLFAAAQHQGRREISGDADHDRRSRRPRRAGALVQVRGDAAEGGEPENPVLIRIETKSGHGASNVTKQIEATADIYAFIMHNLGVTPKF